MKAKGNCFLCFLKAKSSDDGNTFVIVLGTGLLFYMYYYSTSIYLPHYNDNMSLDLASFTRYLLFYRTVI